jgi:membrane-bound serine protease (ClpP class)
MAFLVNTGPVGLGVNPVVIVVSAAVTFGFFVLFVNRVWQARRAPVTTGDELLVGAPGQVRQELSPEGLVFVRGALWKAVAPGGPIPVGSPIKVVGRKGLQLEVVPGEVGAVKEKD